MAGDALEMSLELLRFALDRKAVPESAYFIQAGDEKPDLDDRWCLVRESASGQWLVFYGERGEVSQQDRFERYRDAIKYFYWALIKPEDPWHFRKLWERTTGREF